MHPRGALARSEQIMREQSLGRVRPEDRWNDLHFCAEAFAVVAAIVTHISLMIGNLVSGKLMIDIAGYAVTFVLTPSAVYFVLLTVAFIIKWRSRSRHVRQMTASIVGVLLVFTSYISESHFGAVNVMLVLPMMMAIGYADTGLVTLTSMLTVALKAAADLWLIELVPLSTPKLDGSVERMMDFVLSMGTLLFFWLVSCLFILAERSRVEETARFERVQKKLVKRTITDDLTGIGNRAALREVFDYMMADDSGRRYCVAMTDIDHFKSINDTYGHDVGDEFIKGLANTLRLVKDAEPFRFGGDEFCVVFFGRTASQAAAICEELIGLFGEIPAAKVHVKATASFGVAEWDGTVSPSALLKQADEALYRAKEIRGSVAVYKGETKSLQQDGLDQDRG